MAATFQRDEGETLFDQYEMEGEDPELTRLVDDGLGDLPADDAIGDAVAPQLAHGALIGEKAGEGGTSEPLEDGDAVVVCQSGRSRNAYSCSTLSLYRCLLSSLTPILIDSYPHPPILMRRRFCEFANSGHRWTRSRDEIPSSTEFKASKQNYW